MSLSEWVKRLRILDPTKVKVLDVRLDTVDIEIEGKVYTNVTPRRPFPYTHPEYVILYDQNDEEIGILKDYRKLDKQSRERLERALDLIYFVPKIRRILGVQTVGRHYRWTVLTDRGVVNFETRTSCARILSDGKVIIKDINGAVYCIENLYKLDPRSLAWLSFAL